MEIPFLDLKREISFIRNEINESIDKVIDNTNFILGNEVNVFENNFAKYINTEYCIGVANGTDALEIAINVLELNKDDEIITQANTYVATCFGVTNNNIKLKLVDIDEHYQMDLNELEKNITSKTKCIIIVHFTGSCCNMDKLMDIVIPTCYMWLGIHRRLYKLMDTVELRLSLRVWDRDHNGYENRWIIEYVH
jgi:dTDP-4-amino-4,6-dideoxygalactose transaminase